MDRAFGSMLSSKMQNSHILSLNREFIMRLVFVTIDVKLFIFFRNSPFCLCMHYFACSKRQHKVAKGIHQHLIEIYIHLLE